MNYSEEEQSVTIKFFSYYFFSINCDIYLMETIRLKKGFKN